MASVEHGIPITPSTRFELASVSKPFTAFAVLLLEKAGELSLNDDIRLYLPELPDYGSTITIRDLMHHTSGLSDWVRVRYYAGLRQGDQISYR
jgi:CubicO group peptidase (beta-lactamase class C family)